MSKVKSIDGLPVLDAKRPLAIHVTKGDCNNSDPMRPESCAAAKALRREHKVIDCKVHLGRVYVRQNKGNWQRYETPKSLRNEIIAFDRGGEFQPGEYVLRPISPAQQSGKRQGSKPKFKQARYNPNRKPRKSPHMVANVRGGPA